ncbi:pimeloyl-ACP methyl ester carboxylesterase [Streptosporangium becharense]|uniref:Pimeloyl-ACP methyl ester carboxylesterase n=1 Tax=Streptosporangium becharense TaxID=1816182 RepID=A0A7W9MID8_9ACTN|nr:prolyl oligopeptidase family serine peptidase [Streptosporangium becharense]MBB2913970.1 pimeloyl-ACP methyl ester carboxylesterase [Streptosporangium becharense]MBB5821369.1 pimeloyl-ACP methyl ester carboxylesterase [Streptosporangium becharense]
MTAGTMSPVHATAGEERLPYIRRVNVRFSGRGRYAACLAGDGHRLTPEVWDLTGDRPRPRTLRTRAGETLQTLPVPTDDGHLLLCRSGADGVHRLVLVVPAANRDETSEEYELPAFDEVGVRLTPGPAEGTAALAFVERADGNTTVWRLSGRVEPPEQVVELPGFVSGGAWLDDTGERLVLSPRNAELGTLVLNLTSGAVTPLAGPAGDEHFLLAASAGTLLLAAHRDGAYRLGVRHRDDAGASTVFPDRLNTIEGTVTPLALDPAGERLALAVTHGARSHLLVHDLADDTIAEVDFPTGMLHPAARWTATGLHLVHTTPEHPPGLVTVANSVFSVPEWSRARWESARIRDYEGPGGSIEAVVYGDPVTSPQVVLALHGGPEAAWQFGFDPLFQRLAAAGIAVVAPNQRGSTGYGAAHRDAIRGAWGGPDLADVLHLGRTLAATRGPDRECPALYGISYGAHLALLAAAAQPDLWSRAAVVAPFLSGPALYADGPQSVRNLIDRLGGREEVGDDLGPRDLLALAPRMRLPLLIVHGERDLIIPVTHSRRLHDRLRESGHRDSTGLTYLEVPGGGHDPLADTGGHLLLDCVTDFLHTGSPPGL